MNGSYQTKHPIMRAYRNEVWDMLGNFFNEHRVMVILRIQKRITDALATTAGNFNIPIYSNKNYKIGFVNRPSIPENSKYQKLFEGDLQIKIFLEMSNEFVNTVIDKENQNLENVSDDAKFAKVDEGKKI